MSGLVIRDCGEGDIAAVQRIYAHHVHHGTASFEEEPPSLDEMKRRFAEIAARGLPYLVAERDGTIVGYSYAATYRTRSAYRFTVEDSVYIDPAHMGQGVGKALLRALIERCRAKGLRQIVAIIGDRSAPSIALHAALGFRLVGHLEGVGLKFDRWMDTTLMQLDLSAPPR
jgi:L-amino acid N-acyltransferase YncA